MHFRSSISLFLTVAGLGLVGLAAAESTPLYFSNPEDSVTRSTALMKAGTWPELARYYDLSDGNVARSELESGKFFVRTDPPENAHPGGLWRFREPFALGYTFVSAAPAGPAGIVAVTVGIAIDEGGGMVQRGRTTYHLRKSALGYQLLPASVSAQIAAAPGDPAYALTGGISRAEAAEKLGVEQESGSWHAVYSPALTTWFFSTPQGFARALERVAVPNPPLPAKAPPGFEPKPWRWTPHALPAMDVIATDELARGPEGATRFRVPVDGFEDLMPARGDARGEGDVPREKIWAVLDRARDRGLRVRVLVENPAAPEAHAVLTLARPAR